MSINLLTLGQSNALLFAQNGGAADVAEHLEGVFNTDVNTLHAWGGDASTIYSGTSFIKDWVAGDHLENEMFAFIDNLSADVKDNPTVINWMFNEYDQSGTFSKATWVSEVRDFIGDVRAELGQDASTVPVQFNYIPYPYGNNWLAIYDGMKELAADADFNADMGPEIFDMVMDGDGSPGGSHMSGADVMLAANRIGPDLDPVVSAMLDVEPGPSNPPPVVTPPSNGTDVAWVESFDGTDPSNVLGPVNRWWGNPDWWSVPGQVTQRGGEPGGDGWNDSGVMQPPTGPNAGNGYGTWEVDFNPHGDTIGDYILLWDSKDVDWPGREWDGWETDFGGNPYSAIHYADENGNNQYDANGLNGDIVNWNGENTLAMTWAEDATGRPYFSVALNGEHQYTQYEHIEKDLAHGGSANQSVSFGQQFFWNLDAQQGQNDFTVYEVRYTPDGDPNSHPDGPDEPVDPPPVDPPVDPPVNSEPINTSFGTGPDTLTIRMSQDYYKGNAEYIVKVDGEQVGPTFQTSALHAAGHSDLLTIKGDWAAGEHSLEIVHVNDLWDDGGDRNLWTDSVVYNGTQVQVGETWWGVEGVSFVDGNAPPPVDPPPVDPSPALTTIILGNGKDTVSLDEIVNFSIDGGKGKDSISVSNAHDGTINGGAGADNIVLGEQHENIAIVINKGGGSDVIHGFDSSVGDHFVFGGFAPNAELETLGDGHFKIGSLQFEVSGVETLASTDYMFV
jgi:hypothetical protein